MSGEAGATQTREDRALTPAPDAVLDSLFEEAAVGLALLDADLRFVRVNAQLAAIDGLAPQEHLGRTVDEALPDVAGAARRVIESGEAVLDQPLPGALGEDGGERTFECSCHPVRAGERVAGLWLSVREITEDRRAHEAEERLLGQLAEERLILREVFTRAPEAMLLLWGDELRVRAHNQGALDQLPLRGDILGRRVDEAFPELVEVAEEVPEAVLDRGETLHYEDVPIAFGGEEAFEGNRYYTFSAVPVSGDAGRATGVLVVGRETTEAVRSRRELEQELEDEHRIATQLQVSLMPERLPPIRGADLASWFRPAGDGYEIGGDFFDVFQFAPECFMLVIGDVCGKGAEAASVTALARYTLRAAAIQEGAEPRTLLTQLNEALVRQRDDGRFLTCVCAFLETGSERGLRVTLSAAGHPPPLVVRSDGAVEPVGGGGALLGVWEELSLEERALELRPGDRLVLYTDGVVEAGAPRHQLGERGLSDLLATTARGSAAETVAAVEGAVLARGRGPARDDVAMLVVRAAPARDR